MTATEVLDFPRKAARKAARNVSRGVGAKDTPLVSAEESGAASVHTVAAGQLRAFIERVERLEEDKKAIADDIKEVYAEMKGNSFDTKAVRTLVRLRKKDQNERHEEEAILELYKAALGMA